MNPFLTQVFNVYAEKYKPQQKREQLIAEIAALKDRLASLEVSLASCGATDEEIQQFLVNAEALLGGHASEEVLTNMLTARFGGEEEQPKRRARRKKGESTEPAAGAATPEAAEGAAPAEPSAPPTADVTKAEKDLLKSVMTLESMSVSEVAAATSQHTGDEWLPSDVSPILKAMIKDGSVATEGEKRAKRYMLAKSPE